MPPSPGIHDCWGSGTDDGEYFYLSVIAACQAKDEVKTLNVAAFVQENTVRNKGAEAFQRLPLIFGRCKYGCL
jgi:hypothetical protein